MKVTITTAGHSVEIESTEEGMNVHRLANIAVATWRRTKDDAGMADAWGASGCGTERQHRFGFHRTSGYGGSGFREVEA